VRDHAIGSKRVSVQAGVLLWIELLNHIIGDGSYFSFREMGRL
jgi:DNA repair protein RadC